MSNRYNIVWIDDQFEEIGGFIDEAHQKGFDITPFASSREGMDYLESNVSAVDALILDAKVFKDGNKDVASEKGLMASIKEIARISGKNKGEEIPYVVFTGQPDLESNEEFANRMDGVPIFSKNESTKPVFDKLCELIGNSPNATVRNQYRATYNACVRGKIDPECWRLLAPVLRSVTHTDGLPNDPYNDVRKALEWIFRYLHRHCVIHEKLISDKGLVNLQGISHFLAGKPAFLKFTNETVQAKRTIIPSLLADCIRFVLDVTQPGSHTEDPEDTELDKPSIAALEELSPHHHLIQLVAVMAADIAEWAVNYVEANQDGDRNRDIWIDSTSAGSTEVSGEIECVIITEASGSFFARPSSQAATFGENVRIPKKIINCNLNKGDRVRVSAQKQDPAVGHWLATSVYLEE